LRNAFIIIVATYFVPETLRLLLALGLIIEGVIITPIFYKCLKRSYRNYENYEPEK
jgi:accessory gene regulator protein AgrB